MALPPGVLKAFLEKKGGKAEKGKKARPGEKAVKAMKGACAACKKKGKTCPECMKKKGKY